MPRNEKARLIRKDSSGLRAGAAERRAAYFFACRSLRTTDAMKLS
jgi:hypothetical protein